jgi:hypothetical protein
VRNVDSMPSVFMQAVVARAASQPGIDVARRPLDDDILPLVCVAGIQ